MKVQEVMTPHAQAIWLTESLTDAAKLMWENDCGVLPIIKDENVVGIITDRDICMATAMKDRSPSSISVEEVMTGEVYAVSPEEDVEQALVKMREHKVRRLPVIGSDGELTGIVSVNDILLKAKAPNSSHDAPIDYREIVKTYQAICEHPLPMANAVTVDSRSG